ncbi:MAG: hypothetical protein ACKVT2_19235 [Saprospiraceae bacterium]
MKSTLSQVGRNKAGAAIEAKEPIAQGSHVCPETDENPVIKCRYITNVDRLIFLKKPRLPPIGMDIKLIMIKQFNFEKMSA